MKKLKNGARVSRVAKLQNQVKNLLNHQAQDHSFLNRAASPPSAPNPMALASAPSVHAKASMPSVPVAKAQEPVKKMSPRYVETGHAINVSNFNKLIQAVIGYGSTYVTTNTLLVVAHLQTVYTDAFAALGNVMDKLVAYDAAQDEQTAAFQGLRQLCTRVFNAYKACGTPR